MFIFIFLISLPFKFLTKPLRVLEDEVNKTNKQTIVKQNGDSIHEILDGAFG